MNKYLDRLKAKKHPSVSFGSGPKDRIKKIDTAGIPADCVGALIDPNGGMYLPWGSFLTPDRLDEWQRALFEAVDELARLERWSDDHYDLVIGAIERQPVSTLRPDLAHFRERLDKARAAPPTARRPR